MLDVAGPSRRPTFNTLAREEAFRNPPKKGSTYNILNEFVAPHVESFNSLFDDSGLPSGDGDGLGIISLALKDIGERVVFDRNSNGQDGWGNRMKSMSVWNYLIILIEILQFGSNKPLLQGPWCRIKIGPLLNGKSFQQR